MQPLRQAADELHGPGGRHRLSLPHRCGALHAHVHTHTLLDGWVDRLAVRCLSVRAGADVLHPITGVAQWSCCRLPAAALGCQRGGKHCYVPVRRHPHRHRRCTAAIVNTASSSPGPSLRQCPATCIAQCTARENQQPIGARALGLQHVRVLVRGAHAAR